MTIKMEKCPAKNNSPSILNKWHLICVLTIGIVGVLIRLIFYLQNRSLWADEAKLALNIIDHSFLSLLTSKLDYGQVAPSGFLAIQKLTVLAFGSSELALRLWPLLFGIGSIGIFYLILRMINASLSTIIIAFTAFSLGPYPIRFSTEAKQYSGDVFATLLVLLTTLLFLKKGNLRSAVTLGIAVFIIPIFSHAALFSIGGCAAALIAAKGFSIFRQRETRLIAILGFLGILAASLITFMTSSPTYEFMTDYWEAGFLPFPPANITEVQRYSHAAIWLLQHPFGLNSVPEIFIGFLAMLLGIVWLIIRKRSLALLLIAPLLLLFIASALKLYPIGGEKSLVAGRLILFIHPILAIFIAYGFEIAYLGKRRLIKIPVFAIGIFIVISPIFKISDYSAVSRLNARETTLFIKNNIQPEDSVYTAGLIWSPIQYYFKRYEVGDFDKLENHMPDGPVGKRAWLIHYEGETMISVKAKNILGTPEKNIKIEKIEIHLIKQQFSGTR